GAGRATDGDKTSVVQRIVRHVVGTYVIPDLPGSPVHQRVVFGEGFVGSGECLVILYHWNTGPGTGTLVLALTGDPGVQSQQFLSQRPDLADAATLLVVILVKTEQALFGDQFLYRFRIGKQDVQFDIVMFANRFDKFVG